MGALHGFGASRGVFLTTSAFTSGAIEYAKRVQSRIILVDGSKLVDLMIAYRVGVQERRDSVPSRSMMNTSNESACCV